MTAVPGGHFERLAGEIVASVEQADATSLVLTFRSGLSFAVTQHANGVRGTIRNPDDSGSGRGDSAHSPTRRQQEYLDFIAKYMARFGNSPAEADIQRHFMVSPPSVHQMILTLERRGFITRGRDFVGEVVPRSIRIVHDQR